MLRTIVTSVAQAVTIVLAFEFGWIMLSYCVEHNPHDYGLLVILAVYPLPIAVAAARKHNALLDIMVINLWLGWTMIGWLAVLIWACNWNVKAPATKEPPAHGLMQRAAGQAISSYRV